MADKYAAIGAEMYLCHDGCTLVPAEYCYGTTMPSIDRLFDEGRLCWTVPTGSLSLGGMVLPLHSDMIPCDKHLVTLEALHKTDKE